MHILKQSCVLSQEEQEQIKEVKQIKEEKQIKEKPLDAEIKTMVPI